MIEDLLWIISFITLYLAIVWLNFLYINILDSNRKIKRIPTVDFVIPAFNEEKTIEKTIMSVCKLNYPKDKIRIIVVNDGSKDKTPHIVRKIISQLPNFNIELINKENGGKGTAINKALGVSNAELFAVVDADSYVEKDSLRNMLHQFLDPKTAAVISAIKVNEPRNVYEKVQRIEYILAVLSRKLRASINTLAMTPGALSVYKTKVLKEVGGFDDSRAQITEDLEIALNLKYHGYNVKLESDSYTYTNVPRSFSSLLRQRIRWFRGFVYNHRKYKQMFFKKEHGFFAYFQLPLNIIGIGLLLATVGLITYGSITHIYEFLIRVTFIDGYFTSILQIPSFKTFILGHNLKVMFPIYIALIAGAYMFIVSHRIVKEKLKFPVAIWLYFVALPYLSCFYWVSALTLEFFGLKRKW